MNEKILVIDDEPDILLTVESILTKEGYRVRSASGGAEAIEIFKSEPFGLVITDIRMPEMNGLEVLRRVKEMDEDVEVIIVTGFASTENAIQSLRDDMAFDYLTKPLEKIEDLLIAVKQALEKRRLRMQNKDLLNELRIARDNLEERIVELSLTNEKLQEEILEHQQAEEALTESRQVLRSVFDGISEPLILLGPGLTVRGINRAAKNYFHRETFREVLDKPCHEGLLERSSPCEGCRIAQKDNMTDHISFERKCIFDGSRDEQVDVYCLNEKGLKGAIIRIHDITEKKKIRNQLIRADRLTSLGQLSSGIAHEIRNPLASMRLFLDILCDESKFRQTDQEKEILIEISENIGRVDDIIKRVLDFARPPVTASNTFGVNRLIRKSVKLWSEEFRKSRVKQKLHLENDLPSVRGDKVGIEQVICNLLLNAIEAMDKGGVLGITTTKGISSLNHGKEVVIMEIKDDGPGIKPGDRESIFNPFFTTKPSGTGLGLAISHQIIEHHGGTIHAKSEPGEGTVFTVELPVGALDC
jgi:two-component system, cell cycle sensor histidine kinase and response regulator CckA